MFQSTHPHGVRLLSRISYNSSLSVSIHAPTRGATSPPLHLPAVPCRFNPRTHTGCDRAELQVFYRVRVSIHAPTRGATKGVYYCWCKKCKFQSTHPHGVRPPFRESQTIRFICFNPRTHTGCDYSLYRYTKSIEVSIHAPTRGATN